jgi:outer membrane receptor protein involved in Fe transport
LPNPLLKPERQVGPDFGVDLVLGRRGTLSVTHYRQTAKDLIQDVFIDVVNVPEIDQYQNVARVRNIGWEFEGSLDLGAAMLRANYAYTQSTAEDLGPSYTGVLKADEQLLATPKHTGAVTLTLTPVRGTAVTATASYTGGWTNLDYLAYFGCISGNGPCPAGDFSLGKFATEYSGFTTVNASVDRQLTRAVTAYVGVEDLTDRGTRRTMTNYVAAPGRTATVGVRVKY